ncbi:MAG TPA: VCBS repeat-containing protein, partial [Bacteroidetes bacterium]|nr:VCBS repeat-containing protein [Bacteroidota bacterium]
MNQNPLLSQRFAFKLLRSTLLMVVLLAVWAPGQAQIKNRSGVDSTIFISNTIFVPKHPYESGAENWDVAVGDIDKDGKIDVVSASNLDGKINVHLNEGKGRYNNITSYDGGNYNRSIVLEDFNKDGWLDIATVSVKDMKVNWLMNDGSGRFLPKKTMSAGGGFPHDITAADVNQDGFIDLITVTNMTARVNLHFGDGAGNFTGAKSFPVERKPRSVKVADLNGDGIPDLIVGTDSRTVDYLLG